ncbi:MAG TPA: beta-galactosidase [Anaerolineales bacterium]|nr:beta-galactosidase [Anaerolineales bacterium]
MATVKITDKKIWVDGIAIPLLSGEVHYWRLDPANWRPVLRRAREMGLQVIATYVCWDFHEIEPGRYDFCGETDPRRNLLGFLDLLTAEGFWIILRPGPYIYSEWRNNGVPDDAAQLHRLDPAFRARALPYMHAVVEAVCPYLATHGGRIILWQADNEIDPWLPWYTEQLGLGQRIGPFHDFLCERYGDVDALNSAWGTAYSSMAEARAVSQMFPTQTAWMNRYMDFIRFQHWYVTRVAAWAVKTYRDFGVDVLIYLNAYSGHAIQPWAELESLADLAGPDIYPSRELVLRTDEHRHVLEAVRYTRTYSNLPYIPEFEAGIWHDWLGEVGILPANHYRMICLSALLAGAAGWNWYMLANRDNWYQCPINEWGRTRPDLFEVFQQLTSLYNEIEPASLNKLTHTAVTFNILQRGTQQLDKDVLQSLYQADIDYEFFDVDRNGCNPPLLLYAGGDWLSAAAQEHLKEYVESGGHLVCLGMYPHLDGNLRPLNLLDIKEPMGILSGSPADLWLDVWGRKIRSPWAFNYATTPGTPIVAIRHAPGGQTAEELALQMGLQAGARYTIGYTEQRGSGCLTVIGLAPSPALLQMLHDHLKVPIPSRSLTSQISTALFRRGQELYLFAVNNGNEGKVAEVALDGDFCNNAYWQVHDLISGREEVVDLHDGRLTFPLQRKDGTILHLRALLP